MVACPMASKYTVMSCVWATGAISSTTVTVACAVEKFPEPSYTVKVTVLVPMLLQLKLSGFTLIEAIPQLSLLPLFTSSAVMVACPMASKYTVMSCAWATGAISSTTVTVACAVEKFPEPSYTVKVTVLVPMLLQLKLSGFTLIEAIPQLSLLPLFTSSAVMVACPMASKYTVMSCAWATGAISSTTVTVACAVEKFPEPSYTFKVTVLVPMLLQLKLSGITLIEAIPQLSLLPLFTSSAVMLACPTVFKYTVMSCAWATGAISSTTVTVACAVEKFPEPSYTVKVTVLVPILLQLKLS